jgi:hypothetical protein
VAVSSKTSCKSLRAVEKLDIWIKQQFHAVQKSHRFVGSFIQAPSVAYSSDG